ncbi:MAG: tRNA (guanosine(46)-N7)-methyltransferase TrmB [Bacilli bacterium]
MRLKHIKDAEELIYLSNYVVSEPEQYKGKWNEVFNNNNSIYIEIGCGKGAFIIESAYANPNINYIAVDAYASVLLSVVKKLSNTNISNLKIICIDAKRLDEVFNKEIDKIYLNFSDPWPKKRHYKRRLTSYVFLDIYDKIFKSTNVIEQKTDNDDLFDFSLVSLSDYGYEIIESDNDYLSDICTEYELKFKNANKKINHLIAKRF